MNGRPCASFGRATSWESINWTTARAHVKKLQMRIVKAQKQGRIGKVKSLQWLLTHSFYAKALAVKQVTENSGKKTPGIDHDLWQTPQAKYKAITRLHRRGYQPQPLRRIYIPKKSGKKLRPLGIPAMLDRAMQTLYRYSLEPIAETYADPNSYGFRIGRSTHDAIEQCFNILSKRKSPKWVLEGDITGCFDHISHEWLLENIPMDTEILRKWLKSGYVETQKLFPTEEGTPQGGAISTTLMNLTLDGLERYLHDQLPDRATAGKRHFNKINFVRYADDFIITGESQDMLENKVLPLVKIFLKERGLQLSEEKTLITHINDGLDFLGKNIRMYNNKLLIKPSKTTVKTLLEKVRTLIKSNPTLKQDALIHRLNPVIRGWVNNQRFVVSSEIFSHVDHEIYKSLWQWAKRRHKEKSGKWIYNRYFHKIGNRMWTFSVPMETGSKTNNGQPKHLSLEYATDTKIVRFKKIKAGANPFDEAWVEYYEEREGEKMTHSLKGRNTLLTLWRKQQRCCPVCGEKLTSETGFKLHTNTTAGGKTEKIMVHKNCHKKLHAGNTDSELVLLTEGLSEA